MNTHDQKNHDAETALRTMREMILEADADEVRDLARAAGMDFKTLADKGAKIVRDAIAATEAREHGAQIVAFHRGLSSLLAMLRRRDKLAEEELATKADVAEEEIRRIEYDVHYLPSPRTLFRLERAFDLPSGVFAKLAGAIKGQEPDFEDRVQKFAANAKAMGKLTKEEHQILRAFVDYLAGRS